MNVLSPVTGNSDTTLEMTFSTRIIIEKYNEMGLDVKRFFNNIDTIELRKCSATGYRFYYPFTIFGDELFYKDLYLNIEGYYQVNRWEHKEAKKLITKEASILEVGCGDGDFLYSIKDICKTCVGLELNSTAVDVALAKRLNVSKDTIQNFSKNNKDKFDFVCCFQVLEHIEEVKTFLESMIDCLKPGGQLIIAVPNNNPYLFKREKSFFLNIPPHHAGLWNLESLTNLEKYFKIKKEKHHYEPLNEIKTWYQLQIEYYKKKKPLLSNLLLLIPRPVYKSVLSLFKRYIQGKNILVIYNKI